MNNQNTVQSDEEAIKKTYSDWRVKLGHTGDGYSGFQAGWSAHKAAHPHTTGMQWVRASERLPEKNFPNLIVRYNTGIAQSIPYIVGTTNMEHVVEWLSESPSQPEQDEDALSLIRDIAEGAYHVSEPLRERAQLIYSQQQKQSSPCNK